MERLMFLLIIYVVPIVFAGNEDITYEGLSVQILAKKIEKMEMEIFYIKNENRGLKIENQKLGTKVEEFSLEKREIKSELDSLRHQLEQFKHQKSNNTFAAFTAFPSETRSYVQGQHVMFDVTLKNYNLAYNTEFSAFKCPVSGYFMFFINLYTTYIARMGARVVVDGIYTQPQAYSGTNDNHSGSSFTVVYCNSGGLVWVEADYDGVLYGVDSFSHFSGALLYAI